MSTRCVVCGEMDYSDKGDMPCACRWPPRQEQPQPTAEDYCASEGHSYYGDDGPPPYGRGRCYCGAKPYPPGGPEAVDTEDDELGKWDSPNS